MDNLNRKGDPMKRATHWVSDMPGSVFWRPELGLFVVPEGNVKELNNA